MYDISSLHLLNIIDVHLILWGRDNSLSNDENFKAVYTFIQDCGRFN